MESARFTRHAEERLFERHGARLSGSEKQAIGRLAMEKIASAAEGTAFLDVILREGRLKFQAVVALETRAIVTILPWGDSRRNTKTYWRKLHELPDHGQADARAKRARLNQGASTDYGNFGNKREYNRNRRRQREEDLSEDL